MQLRKALTISAVAVLAIGLAATATASTPTGSTPLYIGVNNSTSPAGDIAIDGIFKSGNASFTASTWGCTGGSASGTVHRGAVGVPDMKFFNSGGLTNGLNITCSTPTGNANISLQNNCSVDLRFRDAPTSKDPVPTVANTHDGTIDTSAYPIPAGSKFNVVRGSATLPATPTPGCVKISNVGSLCTVYVVAPGSNTIPAYWDENITTVGGVNYQDLILDGPGTLTGQSPFCFGLMTGTFTLNQIRFNIKVTGGTTNPGGIDFRLTP